MASLVVLFLLFEIVSSNQNFGHDSVMDRINSGIKIAKDFLGSESVAMKVADFVVRAFQANPSTQRKQPNFSETQDTAFSEPTNENYQNYGVNEINFMSPWKHLIKLFGLQTNQISAVAVNALIFIAQMITTFLSGPKRPARQRSDDLSSWILQKKSKNLQDLIATAKNESLPDRLEQLIQEPIEDTACIRLLVCKITPFVNKMQKTVFGNDVPSEDSAGAEIFYRHLPTQEEINSKNDICEARYRECNLKE
ncbi:unnamed protein product [Leptosia nina]|uniref:Uncharacterized protein n=1 Tax=Leptosia nina TaxID=320188 RepID=A0AAV1J0Q1_9NEOP